jgi:hypothetical protein
MTSFWKQYNNIPAGKYVITTYFQPNFEGGEVKPFPEAAKWKQAGQEVIVSGDKEIVIQMEPVKTN